MFETASDEFNQKVCQRYNTNLQQVRRDVLVLKEWIRQQPHLPQSSSDTLLTSFLIACKNSMERAKEKIDNYYKARVVLPEFFGDRDLETERSLSIEKELRLFLLPKFTPDGCRVHMVVFVTGDPEKYDLHAFIKRGMAYEDVRLNVEAFSMGDYVVIDCKPFSASHLLRITPTLARDFIFCVQDVIPIIIKGAILFNSPTYIQLALNIMKPFMKKKLIERIHIHTEGPEILEKYFPKSMLPSDYGGEEESSDKLHERWNQLLREKRDWLMTEGAVSVDESKRIKDFSTGKDLEFQEIQGSFKALCVD